MKKLTFVKEKMIQATFVASILFVTSCGLNQQPTDTKEVAEELNEEKFDTNMQKDDAQFLVEAAENNLKQIQLGQLAQQKGYSSHVKELGKMMEDAHTNSQRELAALAKRKMIAIPASTTDDAKEASVELSAKSGNDFDKAYADMMVSDHEDAIEAFEKATTECDDTDLNTWARTSLPNLRKHLDHAIDCQKKCDDLASNY